MNVSGVDAKGFTMNFDVGLQNPNAVAIPLTAADYKLGLSGVDVLSGKANPDGTIPAKGTLATRLPVQVSYEQLLAVEQAIVKGGGNIQYAFNGGLSFDTKSPLMGVVRVPLSYQGSLALKEILNHPEALLQSSAARKLAKELMGGLFGS